MPRAGGTAEGSRRRLARLMSAFLRDFLVSNRQKTEASIWIRSAPTCSSAANARAQR
jgi:hypothetical protein